MKYIRNITKAFIASSTSLALIACSNGPSESEIKTLVEREIKPMMEMQLKLLKGANTTLTDVKKIACKADGDSAFKCDVELIISTDGRKDSKAIPVRFIKTSVGWSISQ